MRRNGGQYYQVFLGARYLYTEWGRSEREVYLYLKKRGYDLKKQQVRLVPLV